MSASEMSTEPAVGPRQQVRTLAVLVISAVLISGVVVVAAATGTGILGVPTHYGNGIDSNTGAQIARDFLADQAAEATALSSNDSSALNDHLTGNALIDVSQTIANQSATGAAAVTTFQPTSMTILEARDPSDPSLVIEVQEDGTKAGMTAGGAESAPTQQSVAFHGTFWLRKDSDGHYLIADQSIENQPSSFVPGLAVVVAAAFAVGLAALLVVRQRRRRAVWAGAVLPEHAASTAVQQIAAAELAGEPDAPQPRILIRTFGTLHVLEGGRDYAHAIVSRPVTGFVWLRLLVAAILDPLAKPARDEIARQANPGFSRPIQLKRLRNVVGKGLREMPEPLRARITVEPDFMGFNLDECRVDAIELLAASRESRSGAPMTPATLRRFELIVRECQGEFLNEFEAVEALATDGRPACTDLIRELREQLTAARTELSLRLSAARRA